MKNEIKNLSIAVLYATMLVYLIPMEGILDRENYLIYANNSDLIFSRYYPHNILGLITNEPIWLGINSFLNLFLLPNQVVSLIIFISSFVSSYLILKNNRKYFLFLLIILFSPQFIGKFIIHLRQGLAIAIFLIGWFSTSKKIRYFWFILTPFIHASFFFVLFLFMYTKVLNKTKLSVGIKIFSLIALGLFLGFTLEHIVSISGARQANEYKFSADNVSGLSFIFWFCIFSLYFSQGRLFANKHIFPIATIAFYLSTYFLIEVTGRIFESTLILVLLTSLDLSSWRKYLAISMIVSFEILNWGIRLNQPWFGWGSTF